jgi:hypothetical protein
MAISESALDSGESVGTLDLLPLMSDAALIFGFGGCSDAMRKGVMNPEILVEPTGDILIDVEFRKDIEEQLGRTYESSHLDNAAAKYDDYFKPRELSQDIEGLFPTEFWQAFADEFGMTVDEFRSIRDAFGDLALESRKLTLVLTEREILDYCEGAEDCSARVAALMLEKSSLWPRKAWDTTPAGFRGTDWYPWRFGRRLSLLSRPLVRLEDCNNPRYLISPGLLGDSFTYILRRYFEAEVQPVDCFSHAMRHWTEGEIKRRSHEFVVNVQAALASGGFSTKCEESLDMILGEHFQKNYGDVDVLAWNGAEILAVECKNLRLARTPNDMAEQLNRFSGQPLATGSKRDELRKHIDRCRILNEKSAALSKRLDLQTEIRVKTVVCFSCPVPMHYVASQHPEVIFTTLDDLTAQYGSQ